MPAGGPAVHVTTATRLPAASPERLTLEGAPMPRTTSHSVWPSATVPPIGARAVVDGPAPRTRQRRRRIRIGWPGGRRHAGTSPVGADQILGPNRLVGGQRRRLNRDAFDEQAAGRVEPLGIPGQQIGPARTARDQRGYGRQRNYERAGKLLMSHDELNSPSEGSALSNCSNITLRHEGDKSHHHPKSANYH